jgi:DNA-binding MarR family transcriptional regulator
MKKDIVQELGYLCLGSRLRRLGERLQSDVQRLAASHGLDIQSAHYPLLAAIYFQGPLTVGKLVETLGISQPGVTRSIGQLVDQGYVKVTRSQIDQRRRTLSLTRTGTALIERSQAELWPTIESTLSDLFTRRTGRLLELLDYCEDELTKSSLEQRVKNKLNGTTDERIA